MDIIRSENGIFLLNTNNISYMFRVDRYGHLEHLHFGKRCLISDAEAFSYKKKICHGTTVVYDKDNDIYTTDSLPQEFGTYGVGDFNEASIELEGESSFTCDFLYLSYETVKGNVKMKDLPSSYGAKETLIVHLKDKVKELYLDLYYTIYPEEDVITRRSVLINRTEKDYTLHKLMSFCVDLCEEDLVLMNFCGAWDKETHLYEHEISRGTYLSSSRIGFSSAKNNPGFIIRQKMTDEDHGKAWGFNLVYSGNHYSSVAENEYGIKRVQAGISPERFHLSLKSGEDFETPEAVLTYSDEGLNSLSHHFHDFINEHIVRSDWKKKERPILINSWEGFGFDFRKNDLINKLAKNAASMGIELFVLDDGWFGRRDSDKRGLGDYDCNLRKIPGGISSLSKEIHDLGMLFGIWVEPEAINIDSALYEKHPEFALHEKDRDFYYGRNELLMDLANPKVRDYIVENVSKLIDDNKVDYIKWDMNRLMNAVSGVYSHEYIKGLYEVLDRIFTKRPQVLLESCASGGNRFDLGMLCYSPQIWASDDTDPIERIDIQKGLSYLYPVSTIGSHVSASPHMHTLRHTPLETRFGVSAYGCLGYELDLSLLTALEKREIIRQIEYYKKHRKTFQFGQFYRFNKDDTYETFEVRNNKEAIVTRFRRMIHAVPIYDRLYVKGMDDEEDYTVSTRPFTHPLKKFGNLINFITPVKVNAESRLIELIGKYKGLNANVHEYEASGMALRDGILLDPVFLGTGYNENVRIPPDYGSDMFLITKKKK